ncbi:MAG: hypothetical protein ACRD3W_28980 [Terriglobales bacterium]
MSVALVQPDRREVIYHKSAGFRRMAQPAPAAWAVQLEESVRTARNFPAAWNDFYPAIGTIADIAD